MTLAERIYRRAPPRVQTLLLNAHALRIERHRYGARYRRAVADLTRSEYAPREHLEAYQSERLRKIVSTAYEHSAFYRNKFAAAGVTPGDIVSIRDITRLPLLTKDEVRVHGASMLTRPKPALDWLKGNTSGTTGSPLSIWYDRDTCVQTNAVDRLHKAAAGMRADDWVGVMLGRVTVPLDQHQPPFWRTNLVHRQVWYSSFHLSSANLPYFVADIRRRQLRYLEGYPSTLFILAQHVLDTGDTLPLDAVITSSETLHPVQRDAIERAFCCCVFDFYALAERVLFAGECGVHRGKHISEHYGYAELVDADGAPVPCGTQGYLVGTSLWNTAMPMIRYRTSDITSFLPRACGCGRTSRVLDDVATKAEDVIVTPDGRWISPSVLTHPFKPLHQIAESQIIQERVDHLIVKLVPRDTFSTEHRQQLVAALRERLGTGMEITVELVDHIPRDPSGKLRWVVSRVRSAVSLDWTPLGVTDHRYQ
jgi:phenylacetate-CoA ligase